MARSPLRQEGGGSGGGGGGGGGAAAAASSSAPSRSRSVTETKNGSHHFTINGYSLAKGMGVGKYIASNTFTVGGYQWAIYFYPDGKNAEDNSLYVSVFIALASDGTDVRALFELTLVDQSGKAKHKIHSHFDRSLEGGPYTLKYRGSMWGYKRFFRREALEMSDYLNNDSLDITCTVGVVVSWTDATKTYSISPPERDIGKHFGALFENGEGADITFDADGERFKAHKLVLAARSPVFKAQLMGPLRERGNDVLRVDDILAPVFKAMLQFMYTDSLPDTTELSGVSSSSSPTLLYQHLLAAADRYGLDRLRILCESKLCETVSIDTVATTLALAEIHHASQLKAVCLKFAADNLSAVMQAEGYDYLRESCPMLLYDLLKTVAGVGRDLLPDVAGKGGYVWGQLPDGGEVNGRRVRQKT